MRVAITSSLLRQILDQAERSPDREVCGLLFGSAASIDDACPAANVAPDPTRSFEVDPVALIASHRAERAGGPRLVGHYHSHPNGRADPSPRDAAAAVPGQFWLIVAGGEAQLFRAEECGFRPVELGVR